MDEIEYVKIMKKLIKILIVFIFPTLIIGVIVKMLDENTIVKNLFDPILIIFMYIESVIILILIPLLLFNGINKIINLIKVRKNVSRNKDYLRDIEIKYSPAIISLILDLYISDFKDYTATILYLCYRKYIDLYDENGDVKFKIIEENVQDLNPHEQYVYRCIQGSGFDETKFKKLIIEDAKNLQLISINNGKIKRTPKGENEAKLWKGFKNYIHDYTLISEKDIKHMVILNEYIPYAIALDEAKNIEKFIAEDEVYRNLIYRFYKGKI